MLRLVCIHGCSKADFVVFTHDPHFSTQAWGEWEVSGNVCQCVTPTSSPQPDCLRIIAVVTWEEYDSVRFAVLIFEVRQGDDYTASAELDFNEKWELEPQVEIAGVHTFDCYAALLLAPPFIPRLKRRKRSPEKRRKHKGGRTCWHNDIWNWDEAVQPTVSAT